MELLCHRKAAGSRDQDGEQFREVSHFASSLSVNASGRLSGQLLCVDGDQWQ